MLRHKGKIAFASAVLVASAMAAPSCSSVLGIEELQPGTDGGSSAGGKAGTSAGGATGTAGASSGAGGLASGTGGAAGSPVGGTGVGGTGAGGSGGASGSSGGMAGASGASGGSAGGTPDASATGGGAGSGVGGGGRGGTGGQPANDGAVSDAKDGGVVESGPTTITVHGSVIDYWRHRVPDAIVYLGNETVKTDATGQFTFANVTPPYDLGLIVHEGLIQYGGSENTWLFKGLTRADPTLQVREGLVPTSSTGTTWKFTNFPPAGKNDAGPIPRTVGIAFGSPDAFWNEIFTDPDGTDLGASYMDFEGGDMSAGTARALLWETPTGERVSPSRYVGFNQQSHTIDIFTPKSVTFNMAASTIQSDLVTGTITSYRPDPTLDGYVRFDDGSAIHVVSVANSPLNFQMLMPKGLPNATITVAAIAGTFPYGPFSVAHFDGLTAGQGSVQVNVQAAITQVAPAAGASNVGPNAMFQWSASPNVAYLSVYCKGPLQTDGYTTFNVVTQDYKAQLPVLGGATGIPLPKGRLCSWAVQIHGAYVAVDDAAGPTGFLDPFSYYYYGELWGPKRDNGGFRQSETWNLNTAP